MNVLKRTDGTVFAQSETKTIKELVEENKHNLTWTDLTGANLTGARLNGADLTGAYLTGANLTGARLTGANLTGAYLIGANLTWTALTGVDLTWVKLIGARVLFAGKKKTVNHIMGWTGLYKYWTAVYIFDDNSVGIKMGCKELTVKEWGAGFWNNTAEFPNDGSFKSNMRKHAFDFALNYAKEYKNKENGK